MTRRSFSLTRLVAVATVLVLGAAENALAQLNEHCTVSVLNRTVQVNRDGSWEVPNIPVGFGEVKARATCIENGVTRFGESELFTVPNNADISLPYIELGPVSRVPASVRITAPAQSLSTQGQTVQLVVTATFPDISTSDVTGAATGTSYTTSNPAIATIGPNGLVTAVASGTVILQAINDGTGGLLAITIALSSTDTDGDGIPDDVELANGLDPNNPADAQEDPDHDGLTNRQEITLGTNPRNADTDADTLPDGQEVSLGTNPLARDSDGDGVGDALERQLNTNPLDGNDYDLAGALSSIAITPLNFTLNLNTVEGDAFQQLVVIGVMLDGGAIELTASARGTTYQSSDLSVCNFGGQDGLIFAGSAGTCTITVTNGTFTAESHAIVRVVSPIPLSFVSIPGSANDVEVNGDFAYVAAGNTGLQIVDIANRIVPAIVAALDTPGDATKVHLAGTRAYIADGTAGVQIVDVSNPLAPALIGSIGTAGNARAVRVSGPLAFVAADSAGMQIFDVTTPSSPTLVGSIPLDGNAVGLDVSGGLALVAAGSLVHLVDVTSPATPVGLGAVFMAQAQEVRIVGTLAYVADFWGVAVLDLTLPIDFMVINGWYFPGSGAFADLAVSGGFALGTIASDNQAPIVDARQPGTVLNRPAIDFTALTTGDLGTGVAADTNYAYLTTSTTNSRLYVGQYRGLEDSAGIAPTVSITAPAAGTSMIEGETIPFEVSADDDVGVASVTFTVDGVDVFTDSTAPFELTATAEIGATLLTLGASAVDLAGNRGVAPNRSIAVLLDPLTTVVGRVVRLDATETRQPVAGATVSVMGETGVSGADGTFSIPSVRTFRPALRANASITEGGITSFGSSTPTAPVRSGATDVGDIILGTGTFETALGQFLGQCEFGCTGVSSGVLPFAFPFFGTSYQQFFVNSSGNITFASSDDQLQETLAGFLGGPPRIAAFWDDIRMDRSSLDSSGSVNSGVFLNKSLPGRVVVTWPRNEEDRQVPGHNTIQLTLFSDGRIHFAYHDMTALDAIVGLSPGGLPEDSPLARPVDFSATPYVSVGAGEAIFEQFEVFAPRGTDDPVGTRNNRFDLGGSFVNFTPRSGGGYTSLFVPDSIAPMCTVTSPAAGATLLEAQLIDVTATATDALGVSSVRFESSQGGLDSTVAQSPYTVPFTVPLGHASLTFTVTARDAAGNVGTCSRTVAVEVAPPPVVSFNTPTTGGALISGSTVAVTVQATSQIAVTSIRASANGVPLSNRDNLAPIFHLTVPRGITSLVVTAAAVDNAGRTGTAQETTYTVVPDPLTTLAGRVVDAASAPISGARVSASLMGVTAEVFYYATALTALPDLTGRTPDLVTTVPSLDLRNPGAAFGADPYGLGSSPGGRAIRLTGYLKVEPFIDLYQFTLGVGHTAVLTVEGTPVLAVADNGGQFQQTTSPLSGYFADWTAIQLVTFDNGDLDLQLIVQGWGDAGVPTAIQTADLLPVVPTIQTTTDATGAFVLANVPTASGPLALSAASVTPSRTRLAREVTPIVAVAGGTTGVGDVQIVRNQLLYSIAGYFRSVTRVDPATGLRLPVGVGGALSLSRNVAGLQSGSLVVGTTFGYDTGSPTSAIVFLDPDLPFDRNQTIVSAGGFLVFPNAVAEEPAGTLLVKDDGRLLRVDPSAPSPGNQSVVLETVSPWDGNSSGLVIEAGGTALSSNHSGGVTRLNLDTGLFTQVNSISGCPQGLALESDGSILFTSSSFCGEPAAIHRLTTAGVRTRVRLWPAGNSLSALAVDATGDIYATDSDTSDFASGLWRVNPVTGARTQIGTRWYGLANALAIPPAK